jgi:hypothetical protein
MEYSGTETRFRAALKTPRAAAFAGVAFSVMFAVQLVLVRTVVPSDPSDAGRWLSDSSRRGAVLFALSLAPFAGIAFLWFVGVLRDRVGEAEDRFFATVFLGSGLLFVAMLFVGSAVAGGLIASSGEDSGTLAPNDTWGFGRRATHELIVVYALRMAAVFMIATSTVLRGAKLAPRWLVVSGYVIALVLLVTVGFFAWIELAFPAWVLVVSVYTLIAGSRGDAPRDGAEKSGLG